MCNRNCGNDRGGCARTIALMLLGVGIGKKFCDNPCGCYCITPCPPPCKKPRPKPCCQPRQTVTDCYYARQYALYPCDTPCNRCGSFGNCFGGERSFDENDDSFGGCGCGCRG